MIELLLEDTGIDPQRYAIEWVSGAEGPRFAQKVTEFTELIKELGPNPLKVKEVETCR